VLVNRSPSTGGDLQTKLTLLSDQDSIDLGTIEL
jgi:hypothetical protein